MSIKYYGIYLLYPPTVDLRAEGLGRHLAAFLKGASELEDVRFVIVCPSWSKKSIYELCKAEKVPESSFELHTSNSKYILVKLFETYVYFKKRKKETRIYMLPQKIAALLHTLEVRFNQRLFTSKNIFGLIFYSAIVFPLLMFRFISMGLYHSKPIIKKVSSYLSFYYQKVFFRYIAPHLKRPDNLPSPFDNFNYIEAQEAKLMHDIILSKPEVRAWYSTTAFWPTFNQLPAPTLMCVPDVVLTEFPVGFSATKGKRFLDTFNNVETAIRGGTHFVTYSDRIKQDTLIRRYNKNSKNITVIPHAPNRLDQAIYVHGFGENSETGTISYCKKQLKYAFSKSANPEYTSLLANSSIKFFFYASQFRPSKNVITLLRAYNFLLKNRYIGHKLILTGIKGKEKEIDQFIVDNYLEKEVLLLKGLSLPELAACYKLADLVVNPSMSEGACPFTFTESLSVNTPVIMAKIPVTTELITDPKVQEMMLFDPYSWQDLAARMEWALKNKEQLLETQLPIYRNLMKRTWRHVVQDYISVLDSIAGFAPESAAIEQENCEA